MHVPIHHRYVNIRSVVMMKRWQRQFPITEKELWSNLKWTEITMQIWRLCPFHAVIWGTFQSPHLSTHSWCFHLLPFFTYPVQQMLQWTFKPHALCTSWFLPQVCFYRCTNLSTSAQCKYCFALCVKFSLRFFEKAHKNRWMETHLLSQCLGSLCHLNKAIVHALGNAWAGQGEMSAVKMPVALTLKQECASASSVLTLTKIQYTNTED